MILCYALQINFMFDGCKSYFHFFPAKGYLDSTSNHTEMHPKKRTKRSWANHRIVADSKDLQIHMDYACLFKVWPYHLSIAHWVKQDTNDPSMLPLKIQKNARLGSQASDLTKIKGSTSAPQVYWIASWLKACNNHIKFMMFDAKIYHHTIKEFYFKVYPITWKL